MQSIQHSIDALAAFRRNPRSADAPLPKEIIQHMKRLVNHLQSWAPALSMLLWVKNKPITDEMEPQFESLFDKDIPPESTLICGRQVGKSTQEAAKTIITSACIPYFQTLTITPQFEMTRRYSANYIRHILEYSPIASAVLNSSCEKSVLQKTLINGSIMHFSFAFLDADRIRGISADRVHADEIQDIDAELIEEVKHTTDRSKWRIFDASGTPKTLDNTANVLWEKSSRAEWLIPCSCGYTNNPRSEADALKMIGLKTLVCAKCQKALDAHVGYWNHFAPEKRHTHVGWHIPQIILPFHYAKGRNWRAVVAAKEGGKSKRLFMNEVLGEACDIGAKLITETDLRKAATLPPMSMRQAEKSLLNYMFRVLAVDWGGRGDNSLSFTKLAVLGMLPSGKLDVIYGENLSNLSDGGQEVARAMQLFHQFHCHLVAHDAGGTAGMRDVMFGHAGFPLKCLMPMCYVAAWVKEVVTYHETTDSVRRPYYSVDKTRSLVLTAECIKNKLINFPEYESCKHLLVDFLALIEEKTETRSRSDVYLVRRSANVSDDFAHAVNLGAMAAFYTQGRWPDLIGTVAKYALTPETLKELNPENADRFDWYDTDGQDATELL